eukprot:PITA_32142
MKLAFTRSEADPNLYFKVEDDKPLILVLYVDDLFLTSVDPLIHKCKRDLASKFEMKDLGLMHYFLELEVWQKPREIFPSQGKYVVKILERFGMVDCKPVTTLMELDFKKLSSSAAGHVLRNATEYHQLVGALMFVVNSRPDICFAVNMLSQHMVEPHHIHWIGAKNLLRYLRGTITYGLRYTVGDVRLLGYTDVDWAGSVVDHKSISGCCFSLGSASISWMSMKQKSVALSTAEAEYIAASMAIWNPIFHDRSKHIDIRRSFRHLDTHISSHLSLSLSRTEKSLFSYCAERDSSLTRVEGRMQNLGLQLQIASLTNVDHQTLSQNCVVGGTDSPQKAVYFGEGIKAIRWSVCKILSALV